MNKTKAVVVLILAILILAFVPLVPVKASVVAAEPIVTFDGSLAVIAAPLTYMSLPPISVLACICFYAAIGLIAIIVVRRRLRIFGAPGPPGFIVCSAGSVKVLNFNEVVQKIRTMMLNTDNSNLKILSLGAMTNSLIT